MRKRPASATTTTCRTGSTVHHRTSPLSAPAAETTWRRRCALARHASTRSRSIRRSWRPARRRIPEHPYDQPQVRAIVNDARTFLRNSNWHYDMVVYGLLDSHTLLSHASSVRLDSFVYTVEGIPRRTDAPEGERRPGTLVRAHHRRDGPQNPSDARGCVRRPGTEVRRGTIRPFGDVLSGGERRGQRPWGRHPATGLSGVHDAVFESGDPCRPLDRRLAVLLHAEADVSRLVHGDDCRRAGALAGSSSSASRKGRRPATCRTSCSVPGSCSSRPRASPRWVWRSATPGR